MELKDIDVYYFDFTIHLMFDSLINFKEHNKYFWEFCLEVKYIRLNN